MDVQIRGGQQCDAVIETGDDGRPVLVLGKGLISGRAFAALVVALAPIAAIACEVAQSQQYLQNAS